MDIIERIYGLLKEKKVTAYTLANAVNISQGNISDWKSGKAKPSIAALIKIADYFEVSTDYILTGVDPVPKDLLPDESELLNLYRKLDPSEQLEHRAELKGYIKAKERM